MSLSKMFASKSQNISLLVFLFINFLFSLKYLSRVTYLYIPISFLLIFILLFIYIKQSLILKILKSLKLNLIVLFVLLFVICSILFLLIPKETLNVDRWSVITSFWDFYLENKYVYYAKSFAGNYPGPMPFYFMLAFPFYLIGELGWLTFVGLLLYFYIGLKKYPNESKNIVFLLIVASPFFIWEISSRSNIFFNGVIVFLSIQFFLKNYKKSIKSNVVFGIIFGLLLSTRNVYIIPYIITFIFALKNKRIDLKNTIVIGFVSVITFITTFLPFVWNHIADFKKMNPFIIQADGLLPYKYSLMFILIAVAFAFRCKKENDVYFFSGLVLFFTILFYFGYKINSDGFAEAFFNSKADISYFILCLPFLIYHFTKKEVNC